MSRHTKGLILGISTFIMWGIFPVFFKFIDHISSLQILAHRVVWSFAFLFIFIYFTKRLNTVRRLLKIKKLVLNLLLTSFLITSSWGVYIYAVNIGKILETSLGYFLSPLISIILGAVFLKEKLNLQAKISLIFVIIAIIIQIYALGGLPIISLALPLLFSFYGLIRKKISIPSFEGLFIETMLITPFALSFLAFAAWRGENPFGLNFDGLMLVVSGLVTILPLLTFTASTRILPLTTIGFLQYIGPSLSMLVAVFIYGEELSTYKIISFVLIWIGLIIMSLRRKKYGSK